MLNVVPLIIAYRDLIFNKTDAPDSNYTSIQFPKRSSSDVAPLSSLSDGGNAINYIAPSTSTLWLSSSDLPITIQVAPCSDTDLPIPSNQQVSVCDTEYLPS